MDFSKYIDKNILIIGGGTSTLDVKWENLDYDYIWSCNDFYISERLENKKIDLVLKLSVSLETIKKRILERKSIEKRADDNEKIAIKRFETYEQSSEPVINYYKQSKLLNVVNGERSISQISDEISRLIDSIKG